VPEAGLPAEVAAGPGVADAAAAPSGAGCSAGTLIVAAMPSLTLTLSV
jgi:hypothetical protein